MKKTLYAALAVMMLGGCSSWMNIGEKDLSGPVPQGFACADGIDALALTDNYQDGDNLDYDFCQKSKKKKSKSVQDKPSRNRSVSPFAETTIPYIEAADEPKPILMPAQVMRVWVNAYESQDGSLVYPGRTFTEITPRRWNIGYSAGQGIESNRLMSPLMVKRGVQADPEPEAASGEEAQAAQAASEVRNEAEETNLSLNAVQRAASGPSNAAGPQGTANPLPPLQ